MRVMLVTTATLAGGVRRHIEELSEGLERLGCNVVDTGPADVVHIHLHDTYDRRALSLAITARAKGAAVILTEHLPRTNASDPSLLPGGRHRGASSAKWLFKRGESLIARRIITVCEGSRTFLHDRYGIAEDRMRTIVNGVALTPLPSAPTPTERLRVVSIGTLNVQKGHDVLLAAAAHARGDWSATIIGSGSSMPELERLATRLGHHRVSLTGWRDDAMRAPSMADVLCLPSRWEACPYVVLDAMAQARCVVASRIDGLPELVVHGVNGMLVEPDDPRGLARVLDELARRPSEVERMGLAGRARAEAYFGVDRMVAATHDLYREVLGA